MASDSFSYGDGDLETVSSGAWSRMTANASISVLSNAIRSISNAQAQYFFNGSFSGDQESKITIVTLPTPDWSGEFAGVGIKCSGSTGAANRQGYFAQLYTASNYRLYLFRWAANVMTELGSYTTPTVVQGDVLRIANIGSTVKVYIGATEVRSETDGSPLTTGNPGITLYDGGGFLLDDWVGGVIGGALPVIPASQHFMRMRNQ